MDSFLWAVLVASFILVIFVVSKVTKGKTAQARISAVSDRSFKELAKELREDNSQLKERLSKIEENLDSINKMMKEIE